MHYYFGLEIFKDVLEADVKLKEEIISASLFCSLLFSEWVLVTHPACFSILLILSAVKHHGM